MSGQGCRDRRDSGEWTIGGYGYLATVLAAGAVLGRLTYRGADIVAPSAPMRAEPRHTHQEGPAVWGIWQLVDIGDSWLTLRYDMPAHAGCPFSFSFAAEYDITADGLFLMLTSSHEHTGVPFGCGPSPRLRLAAGRLDDWVPILPGAPTPGVHCRPAPVELRPGCQGVDRGRTGAVAITDPAGGLGVRISWTSWSPRMRRHRPDRIASGAHHSAAAPATSQEPAAGPMGPPAIEPGGIRFATWLIGISDW